MLFLVVLAFLASSNLLRDVAATDESARIQSHDKEINKRSDGLMHELVSLLADEKFHRKTNEMVDRMVKQNEKILKQFAGFSKKFKSFETEMIKIKKALGTNSKNGAVYIRWGRTKCPSNDTKLVYSGYAAGAWYGHHDGADTQCLPKNPNWRRYNDGDNSGAHIYGAEYQTEFSAGEALQTHYLDYKVPCAVCQSKKRLNVHMIPAKDRCNSYGWHLEYRGYLMTQAQGHGASNYACVDANPENIGSKHNHNGRLFYPVESICGSLPCPPYVNHRELTCAVCTF